MKTKRQKSLNNRVERGMATSQDQLPGEGDYANVERQSLYDGHILTLCCAAALNAWDKMLWEK